MDWRDLLPDPAVSGRYQADWRLSDAMIEELARLLVEYRPKSIFETGPGFSSHVFCKYVERAPDVEYLAIDHLGPHYDEHVRCLAERGFDASTTFACPLAGGYYCIDASTVAEGRAFDLMCLDGPPISADRASPAALHFVKEHCRHDTILIQDDTNRGEEAGALRWWLDNINGSRQSYDVWDTVYPWRKTSIALPYRRPMQEVDVAITTWPRSPERVEYFRNCVSSLRKHLHAGEHEFRLLCSLETHASVGTAEIEAICRAEDVFLLHRTGPPSLGANLNYLLAHCFAPYTLYVQDDLVLLKDLNLATDIAFLEEHPAFSVLRYYWHPQWATAVDLNQDLVELLPTSGHLYSDLPHIRRREWTASAGRYIEGDSVACEVNMNDVAKGLAFRFAARRNGSPGGIFQHIGSVSSMWEKQ